MCLSVHVMDRPWEPFDRARRVLRGRDDLVGWKSADLPSDRAVCVGAASLAAAAGHITPRASDGHPALLARHVLSMLKTARSSFPTCLRINSFQNYSAEVETRAEYVGGTTVARDRVAEQRCSRAIAAKAPTLDALLRALPRPTPAPPSVVYEAYRGSFGARGSVEDRARPFPGAA